MDSILEVKEQLAAKSKTATLDELKSQGRKLVKVIRAEHIAAMVHEAVQKAVEGSDMISKEAVDSLVERGKDEFKEIARERQDEIDRLRVTMRELEAAKEERVQLEAKVQQVRSERDQLREMIDHSRKRELEHAKAERERDEARQEVEELRARLEQSGLSTDGLAAPAAPAVAPAAGGGDLSSDLVMKLMNEVAELKAGQIGAGGAPAPAPAPAAAAAAGPENADPGISAAIDKLAGTLNERLDSFGRKMGISSAVDAEDVNFDGLFNQQNEQQLESNMDSVQVKKKTEGGIAANLERLKKLKEGG